LLSLVMTFGTAGSSSKELKTAVLEAALDGIKTEGKTDHVERAAVEEQKVLTLKFALDTQKQFAPGYAFGGENSILASQHSLGLAMKGMLPGKSAQPRLFRPRPSSAPAAHRRAPVPSQDDKCRRETAPAGFGGAKAREETAPFLDCIRMTSNMDSRAFVSQLDRPNDVSVLIRSQTLPGDLGLTPLALQKPTEYEMRRPDVPPEPLGLRTKFALEAAVGNSSLARFSPMRFGCNIVRLERQRTFARSPRTGAGRGGSAAALAEVSGAGEFIVRRLRAPHSEPLSRPLLARSKRRS
jgi:hypothetical protein